MDHQDLPGQCSANNALQYDENIANYDYSTKIMSNYNVNETMMTEALSSTQSNVVSDPYNYNFMQTDNFYSNSVPQQHIPMKSELDNNASAFCIDLSNAVHSDSDSYTNTSDPQLCIDITAGSADLNMQPEQSHYGLTSNLNIKENLFHEEKHIIDDNFTNNQLSSNSIPHHMSNTYTNEFSNIQHQNELYCNQVCQEPLTINDMPTNQDPYAADLHNMNNVSNQSSIQPPIDIHSNFQEALKIETPVVKEESSCQQSEIVQVCIPKICVEELHLSYQFFFNIFIMHPNTFHVKCISFLGISDHIAFYGEYSAGRPNRKHKARRCENRRKLRTRKQTYSERCRQNQYRR